MTRTLLAWGGIATMGAYVILVLAEELSKKKQKRKERQQALAEFFSCIQASLETPAGWIVVDPEVGPETGAMIRERVEAQYKDWTFGQANVLIPSANYVRGITIPAPAFHFNADDYLHDGDLFDEPILLTWNNSMNVTFDGTFEPDTLKILGIDTESDEEV